MLAVDLFSYFMWILSPISSRNGKKKGCNQKFSRWATFNLEPGAQNPAGIKRKAASLRHRQQQEAFVVCKTHGSLHYFIGVCLWKSCKLCQTVLKFPIDCRFPINLTQVGALPRYAALHDATVTRKLQLKFYQRFPIQVLHFIIRSYSYGQTQENFSSCNGLLFDCLASPGFWHGLWIGFTGCYYKIATSSSLPPGFQFSYVRQGTVLNWRVKLYAQLMPLGLIVVLYANQWYCQVVNRKFDSLWKWDDSEVKWKCCYSTLILDPLHLGNYICSET